MLAMGLHLATNAVPALSQDVEPRRWTLLPVGTSLVGIGYVYPLSALSSVCWSGEHHTTSGTESGPHKILISSETGFLSR
jgi:hypothetical protein